MAHMRMGNPRRTTPRWISASWRSSSRRGSFIIRCFTGATTLLLFPLCILPSFNPITADIPQQPLIGPKIGFDGCYGYIFSYGYSPTSAIYKRRKNKYVHFSAAGAGAFQKLFQRREERTNLFVHIFLTSFDTHF